MIDACSGGHALKISGSDDGAVAHAVFMAQSPLDNVRYYFHILMPVGFKSHARFDGIIIDHTKRPEAHIRGIMIIAKRKSVVGVEPTVIRVSALFGSPDFNIVCFHPSRFLP